MGLEFLRVTSVKCECAIFFSCEVFLELLVIGALEDPQPRIAGLHSMAPKMDEFYLFFFSSLSVYLVFFWVHVR